jgi:OOP family OmpA-OmpF porin
MSSGTRFACLSSAFLLLVCAATGAGAAKPALPSYLGFLAGIMSVQAVDHEDWNEYPFPPAPGDQGPDIAKQGKHWHIYGPVNGGGTDKHVTWAVLKAGFVAAGWEVIKEFDTQPLRAVLHLKKNGLDVWADVGVGNPPNQTMEVIEVAPLPFALTLAQPAATPENIDPEKGNFPYLAPLPGSKPTGGRHDSGPLYVTLPGASQPEIVATGNVIKSYRPADGVSQVEWFTLYRDALPKAGWTIINTFRSGDAAITAHYGQNGRNIWAFLHMGGGGYSFQVGDEGGGSGGLGADLARECHVALTGVLFDFNKSTLKPESDPVLERVRGLLVKDAALKLEVQGHTDNVGTDAYNQTLSEARAAAVDAWLTQHGIAGGRLSAKGYGKTVPVADNRTDEGRAKNRRVEISNPACAPQRK